LSSDTLVPFRWPAAWTDPPSLRLLAGSPINCLLFDNVVGAEPIATAARGAGLTVLEWSALQAAPLAEVQWDSAAPRTVITGLSWPRIKLSATGRANAVDAGPTGAPWIDSNTWVARLAAVRSPRKAVWLGFELTKDDPVPGESAYQIAIADSAATGARWMISLDDGLRKGAARGQCRGLEDLVRYSVVAHLLREAPRLDRLGAMGIDRHPFDLCREGRISGVGGAQPGGPAQPSVPCSGPIEPRKPETGRPARRIVCGQRSAVGRAEGATRRVCAGRRSADRAARAGVAVLRREARPMSGWRL
jgi:hypothetical protein